MTVQEDMDEDVVKEMKVGTGTQRCEPVAGEDRYLAFEVEAIPSRFVKWIGATAIEDGMTAHWIGASGWPMTEPDYEMENLEVKVDVSSAPVGDRNPDWKECRRLESNQSLVSGEKCTSFCEFLCAWSCGLTAEASRGALVSAQPWNQSALGGH